MRHLDQDTGPLAFTVFVKEKPVDAEYYNKPGDQQEHSGKAFVSGTFRRSSGSRGLL
jgi:hypothetical protein